MYTSQGRGKQEEKRKTKKKKEEYEKRKRKKETGWKEEKGVPKEEIKRDRRR